MIIRSTAEILIRNAKDLPPLKTSDCQVDRLKQQSQSLELQMAASERVRRHLEASLRDMTADFETLDGSKQSLQSYKAQLARENSQRTELLNEETQARRATDNNRVCGLQAMWNKSRSTTTEERESYKNTGGHWLVAVHDFCDSSCGNASAELDKQRRQNQELSQAWVKFQANLANLQAKLERETLGRNEETGMFRIFVLVARMCNSFSLENYVSRLEQSDIERAMAVNGEKFGTL